MTQLLTEPVAILRVAVQAAYPSVRAGLRAMLAASPNFELTDDAADVTVADLEEGATIEDWPAGPAVLLVGFARRIRRHGNLGRHPARLPAERSDRQRTRGRR